MKDSKRKLLFWQILKLGLTSTWMKPKKGWLYFVTYKMKMVRFLKPIILLVLISVLDFKKKLNIRWGPILKVKFQKSWKLKSFRKLILISWIIYLEKKKNIWRSVFELWQIWQMPENSWIWKKSREKMIYMWTLKRKIYTPKVQTNYWQTFVNMMCNTTVECALIQAWEQENGSKYNCLTSLLCA